MKILRFALTAVSFLALGWLSVGCAHGQIPQPTHSVTLTYAASAGTTLNGVTTACTTSGADECTYVMSRYTMTATDKGCPTVNMSTPNYTPLNSASPTNLLTYTDLGSAGTSVCYTVQAIQLGSPSVASNVAGPYAVQANVYPAAPSLGNGTVASVNPQPALPSPNADTAAPVLTAVVR